MERYWRLSFKINMRRGKFYTLHWWIHICMAKLGNAPVAIFSMDIKLFTRTITKCLPIWY